MPRRNSDIPTRDGERTFGAYGGDQIAVSRGSTIFRHGFRLAIAVHRDVGAVPENFIQTGGDLGHHRGVVAQIGVRVQERRVNNR